MVVAGPFGESDLAHQFGPDPGASPHFGAAQSAAEPWESFRQVRERAIGLNKFLEFAEQSLECLFVKAGADLRCEQQPVIVVITHEDRAKMAPSALGTRVAADHKLLFVGPFEFHPGAGTSPWLV